MFKVFLLIGTKSLVFTKLFCFLWLLHGLVFALKK